MSFSTDLNYLMTNDPSTSAYCTGGIHYENLPDNFQITKDWIVYSFNKSSEAFCMGSKGAYMEYTIYVKVVAGDTLNLETISDRLVDYLNGNEYGEIGDLLFQSDNHTSDLEKGIYMNTLTFTAFYWAMNI
jgi:hypothetical protein